MNNRVIVTGKNIRYPIVCYKRDLKKLLKKYKSKYKGIGTIDHPAIFVHNGVLNG
jgi:hypothetical protein